MSTERMVIARFVPTRTDHRVYAAGGPAEGSLYGMDTVCGRTIEQPEQWLEAPTAPGQRCQVCWRDS